MKIADHPATIPQADQYTAGDIAVVLGISHRTACKLIDAGTIAGHKVPGSRERRVLHATLLAYVAANPTLSFVLAKIKNKE